MAQDSIAPRCYNREPFQRSRIEWGISRETGLRDRPEQRELPSRARMAAVVRILPMESGGSRRCGQRIKRP